MSQSDSHGEGEDAHDRSRLADLLRRVVSTGVSAVFLTEEGVRQAISDIKPPAELVGTLLSQTEKSRKELTRLMGEEVRAFFNRAEFYREFRKALIGLRLEVRGEIRVLDDRVDTSQLSTQVDRDRGVGDATTETTGPAGPPPREPGRDAGRPSAKEST